MRPCLIRSAFAAAAFALLLPLSAAAAPPPARRTTSASAAAPIRLAMARGRPARLFAVAEHGWSEGFKPVELRSTLQRLASGKTELSPAQAGDLKETRKQGAILRSSYVLFDRSHESPPALSLFVRDLGRVNDAVQHADAQRIAEFSSQALTSLDPRTFEKEARSFAPATSLSFNQTVAAKGAAIETSLRKGTVTAREFHEVRKNLRDLLNVFRVDARLRNEPSMKETYQRLDTVTKEMGAMHDTVVGRAFHETIDEDEVQMTFPPAVTAQIQQILADLRRR